jgi:hypothetical protein
MDPGVGLMGRPKRGAKKKPAPSDERVAIIHLKGSPEYAAWLDEFHRKTHIPKATLFRLGMVELAVKYGHSEPPEM